MPSFFSGSELYFLRTNSPPFPVTQQAEALQPQVGSWGVQMVIVSPLRRTLQTACLAFAHTTHPLIAWPLVTEFWGESPECQGQNVADLRADPLLASLPRFRTVTLDNVEDGWWAISNDKWRLHSFMSWLRCCPETRIAVVCHWGVIHNLLTLAHHGEPLAINNCCLLFFVDIKEMCHVKFHVLCFAQFL